MQLFKNAFWIKIGITSNPAHCPIVAVLGLSKTHSSKVADFTPHLGQLGLLIIGIAHILVLLLLL